MHKEWYIYALCEPDREEDVRYVGLSVSPDLRLDAHLSASKQDGNSAKKQWLQGLQACGRVPTLRILARVTDTPLEHERQWIAYYREKGANLLNIAGNTPLKSKEWVKLTCYLTQEDVLLLEELRLAAIRRGEKADKSALVREALALLQREKGGAVHATH